MFWGGSLPPINIAPINLVPGFIWFILKVMLGILFYVWLRATLPRLRYDALMNLGWKRLLPLGLVWLFVLAGYNLATHPHTDTAAMLPSNDVDVPNRFVPRFQRADISQAEAGAAAVRRGAGRRVRSAPAQPETTPTGAAAQQPEAPAPIETIGSPDSSGTRRRPSVAPAQINVPGAHDVPGDRTRLSTPDSSGTDTQSGTSGQ